MRSRLASTAKCGYSSSLLRYNAASYTPSAYYSTKVNARQAQTGPQGQKILAAGQNLSMRMWENEKPSKNKPQSVREYETVGYVLSGKAELNLDGKKITLEAGDSWVVPKGVSHSYDIIETFTAVEANHPPSRS